MSRKILSSSITLAAAATLLTATAAAQAPSTIDPAALDAAVTAPQPDARAVVREALSSESATAAAARLGLTPEEVSGRVAALDDASVRMLADRILAGGDRIVISATALIIILLILILITD